MNTDTDFRPWSQGPVVHMILKYFRQKIQQKMVFLIENKAK
jgi:hypothetical protein